MHCIKLTFRGRQTTLVCVSCLFLLASNAELDASLIRSIEHHLVLAHDVDFETNGEVRGGWGVCLMERREKVRATPK